MVPSCGSLCRGVCDGKDVLQGVAPAPPSPSGHPMSTATLATVISDFAQQYAPLLTAVLVLGATYLFVKQIQQKGCPFAGRGAAAGPKGKQGAAMAANGTAAAAAAAVGDVRLTLQQLSAYDGSDGSKPLYIAVRGKIYDVSAGRSFYGPGGPYAVFAGKECSRALAFMKVTAEDCSDDLSGATEAQLATLADWEAKFIVKYGVAGLVVPT